MPFGNMLRKSSLVEYLNKQFDSFIILYIFEYLYSIDFFVLIVSKEINLSLKIRKELLLVSIFW